MDKLDKLSGSDLQMLLDIIFVLGYYLRIYFTGYYFRTWHYFHTIQIGAFGVSYSEVVCFRNYENIKVSNK